MWKEAAVNLFHVPYRHFLSDWVNHEMLVGISGLRVKIWTRYLHNTKEGFWPTRHLVVLRNPNYVQYFLWDKKSLKTQHVCGGRTKH
jgi:hypothetical protein